jgi:L-alanine-DL-glutamate epimerase-like enolase superfamily enzyme
LRSHLARPEIELKEGQWLLPTEPGIGVDLDEATVKECMYKPVTVIE